MKFLSTKIHGLGDYAAGIVLIVAPFLLGIGAQSIIAQWVSVAGGVGLIIYSLCTDYAFSAVKIIPLKLHLLFDVLAGVAFVLLPFILGLDGVARIYFIVMGVGVLLVVVVTDTSAVSPDTPAS
jgi:hypothetical protein